MSDNQTTKFAHLSADQNRIIARLDVLEREIPYGLWDYEPMLRIVSEEVARERDRCAERAYAAMRHGTFNQKVIDAIRAG